MLLMALLSRLPACPMRVLTQQRPQAQVTCRLTSLEFVVWRTHRTEARQCIRPRLVLFVSARREAVGQAELSHVVIVCLDCVTANPDSSIDLQFLQLYWSAAVVGGGVQCYWDKYRPSLGASGAVNAIVIMSAALSPHRIFMIYGVVPLAAYQAAGLWLAYDMYGASKVRSTPPRPSPCDLTHVYLPSS